MLRKLMLITTGSTFISLGLISESQAVTIKLCHVVNGLNYLSCEFQETKQAFSLIITPDNQEGMTDGVTLGGWLLGGMPDFSFNLPGSFWQGTITMTGNSVDGLTTSSSNIQHIIGPHDEDQNPGQAFSFTQSILPNTSAIHPPRTFTISDPTNMIKTHVPHQDFYVAKFENVVIQNLQEIKSFEFILTGVHTPEPTSTLSLLSLGILGAGVTLKRKLKRNHSPEKKLTKVG